MWPCMICLLSISIVFLRFIHAEVCASTSSLFMAEKYSTVWIKPQSVGPFIYRWTFGMFLPFGPCEQYRCEHSCTWICLNPCFGFFLDIYLELEMLSHRVILCLTFQTAILFFTAAAPFYILTSNAWGFQFLHSLTNISFLFLFFLCSTHPDGYEVVSHCDFDVHFLDEQSYPPFFFNTNIDFYTHHFASWIFTECSIIGTYFVSVSHHLHVLPRAA